MQKVFGMMLLIVGASQVAMAMLTVPEIGVDSAGSAIALISGAILVIRGRRK